MKTAVTETAHRRLWLILGIAVVLVSAVLLVKTEVTQAGNETSRLAMVQSVVDNGTCDITESIFKTPDKAQLNGRLYCDKPPLLTWFTTGEYFLLAKGLGLTFRNNRALVLFLLNLPYFLMGIGTGFLCYFCLTEYIGEEKALLYRASAAFLSVASTLVFSYSVTIGNHVPCAFFLMFLLLLMIRAEKRGLDGKNAFLTGVTAGLLFNCEFVLGGTFGLGAAAFVLISPAPSRKERMKKFLCYAAGGVLLLAMEGVMNFMMYRSPLPLYLLTHKPVLVNRRFWYYVWNCLFGFEGFFLYMPACLFVFPALCRPFRGKDRVCACMLGSALVSTVIFLCSTSDYGGFCYGYRFLIPLAPVLLFYVFLAYYGKFRKGTAALLPAAALLWGCITAVTGTFNPWNCGYEGSLTPRGNRNEQIRNGFAVNAFVFFYENCPDSYPVRFFTEKVYGPETACFCLIEEFINRNRNEKIPETVRWFQEHYPAEK